MPRPRQTTDTATAQRTVRLLSALLRQWDELEPIRCKYRIRLVIADNKRLIAAAQKEKV